MTDPNRYWSETADTMRQEPVRQEPQRPYQPQAGQTQAQPAYTQATQAMHSPQPAQGAQAAQPQPTYVQPQGQGQQVAYVAQQPKKSRGWIVAIVVAVCLLIFGIFAVSSCSRAVDIASGVGDSPEPNSIAVIDIDGTIQYDGTACSPEGFKALLDEAADDDNVKGVVLRVNSGGGTATAGEEMAIYLADFTKPVVVSSASINASAAYEISSQADYIYVAKSTEIGSIGTAMQLTDLSGLLKMLGVDVDVIASAESKDSSYGYRPLTDDEREHYQRMVDQINENFVQTVAEGRGMSVEGVRLLANGLAYTGMDAVNNGLADEIGTLEDATDKAASLAGIEDYNVYSLGFSDYDLAGLYDLLGRDDSSAEELLKLLAQKQGARTVE